MARKYVNPNHRPGARTTTRIHGRAEFEALMTRDPGPWSLIKTADLEDLVNHADLGDRQAPPRGGARDDVAMNWPELAAALAEGLR